MEEIVKDLSKEQLVKKSHSEDVTLTTDFKLYSKRAILGATFLGTPLAGGYLMKSNLLSLGQEELAKKVFAGCTVSTFLMFTIILFIPEPIINAIPNTIIPAIYTAVLAMFVDRFMSEELKGHEMDGREFHSGWKAFGISLLALIPVLLYFLALSFIIPV